MSDWFKDNTSPEETPKVQSAEPQETPAAPAEPSVPAEPVETAAPVQPVVTPAPQSPATDWRENPYAQTPPASSWNATGNVPPENQSPQSPYGYTPYGNVPPAPPQPPKKKRNNGAVIALAIIGAVAITALLGLLIPAAMSSLGYTDFGSGIVDEDDDTDENGQEDGEEQEETINNNAPSLSITDWKDDDGGLSATAIINANQDCTVVINVYQMQMSGGAYQFGFGTESLEQVGEASGIVMSKDGYIITNWHVVIDEDTGKPFDEIEVVTYDGTKYEKAKVIGSDQSTDLAVIKVEATDLKVPQFGDSSKLVMGARVLTLGNAGGLQWSASQGIISGLARDVYEDTGYSIKCLQTDAAINPGNSGGPLLNSQGQVVGINSAKIAAEGYEGLGFSIPINEAKAIIDDLVKYGYVRGRVELGITGYSVASNGYYGFVIKTIEKGSMLENTKARVGDLITAVDGVKIDGYGALRAQLAKHEAGEEVTLSLLRLNSRTGEKTTFEVTCKLQESKPTK